MLFLCSVPICRKCEKIIRRLHAVVHNQSMTGRGGHNPCPTGRGLLIISRSAIAASGNPGQSKPRCGDVRLRLVS